MTEQSEFRRFAERLLSGEDRAARELLARYSARLIVLASTRLNPRLRSKVDSDDVLQSVMRSFFRRVRDGRVELRDWQGLWGLLTLMTLRKCARYATRYGTERRDAQREQFVPGQTGSERFEWALPGREPGPEEAVVLADAVNDLLSRLDDHDREIVERTLAGQDACDTAAELGCSERTVQRTLFRVRHALLKRNDDEEHD